MEASDPGGRTSAAISNPSPVNCRTCHAIHTSYTQADYMRIYDDPVPLLVGGATFDIGEANICASCHQARSLSSSQVPDLTDPAGTIALTSSRYGVHHGPQANTLTATGAFAFPGSTTIPTGPNAHGTATVNANGCVTCHMAEPRGDQAGAATRG
jgi:cytochrome c peroxidase